MCDRASKIKIKVNLFLINLCSKTIKKRKKTEFRSFWGSKRGVQKGSFLALFWYQKTPKNPPNYIGKTPLFQKGSFSLWIPTCGFVLLVMGGGGRGDKLR